MATDYNNKKAPSRGWVIGLKLDEPQIAWNEITEKLKSLAVPLVGSPCPVFFAPIEVGIDD